MPAGAGRIRSALESGKVKVDQKMSVDYKSINIYNSLILNVNEYCDGENMKTDIKTISVDLYFMEKRRRDGARLH